MCLAIPGKVLEEFERRGMRMAKVQFGGIVREASHERRAFRCIWRPPSSWKKA